MTRFDFASVNAVGLQVTTSGSSAVAAIPVNAAGRVPKHVLITALASCYVRPSGAGGTCTVNDILVPAGANLPLDVSGFTHIAHLQETAAAKFNITPLES